MSLGKLKAKARLAGGEHREITVKCPDGTEEAMMFREAMPPDYSPFSKRVSKLNLKYPRLQGTLLLYVVIYGTCYLQPEEERGQSPDEMFAHIACNDLQLWYAIVAAHKEKFPECALYTMGVDKEDEETDPFVPSAENSPSGV